ncbi:CHAT domain-containing protein [Roseateles sp. MS654]|uniref:CHAT domain-containing protein n=1 Tax=Roseateles sp. MS654 TaxID=3412685 RepID=UPI003C300F3C
MITSSERYGRQATQALIYSTRAMMLRELVPEGEGDYYRGLLQCAIEFMARHPEDKGIRRNLISLLSVESCGTQGLPLIAVTMLNIAQSGIAVSNDNAAIKTNDEESEELLNDDVKKSLENVLLWMGGVGGVEAGVSVAPAELLLAPPDSVVKALAWLARRAGDGPGAETDIAFMEHLVQAACAVCSHATQERDEDIRLLRNLAVQFTAAGQMQSARDYAEQILLIGQTSPFRQRLAWACFADIHHRCRHHALALVGMACALVTRVPVPKADAWHELYTVHRILRDLGLTDLARNFLPAMRRLMEELALDPVNDPRIVAAELGLDLMEAPRDQLDGLLGLLSRIARAAEAALGDKGMLYPLAALLSQAAAKVEAAGGAVPSATQSTLDSALNEVGPSLANTIRSISSEKPVANDVLTLFNSVQRAAFAADMARDYAYIEMAARRLLNARPNGSTPAEEAAFSVELLADQTVKLASDPSVMTLDMAANYAFELNDAGCDVVFLALDGDGELSVTYATKRGIRTIEQPRLEKPFRRRFGAWLVEHPHRFGIIDSAEGGNPFFLTMEQLDVRLPQAERLIVVAEPVLQQLTVNLVVMHPDDGSWEYLAGTRCAIGSVPSLTWLAAARDAPRSGRSAYRAWISAQLDADLAEGHGAAEAVPAEGVDEERDIGQAKTLDIALGRLAGSFEEFGFSVDTGRRLPRGMQDASLAVITAHGGLNSEGRYLHSIRDDDDLVEPPANLAAALEGVELVILFVCSGGRIDKNPWDNSTTSLPKQLLNRGVRAVVASRWPLNVMVTYNWLDPFLRAWEAGATVLDATKTANDFVAQRLGHAPQYALAMGVYGDVLLTRANEPNL